MTCFKYYSLLSDNFFVPAGVVIGFQQRFYSVNESVGSVDIGIVVKEGQLRRSVMVTVLTEDGTAQSRFHVDKYYIYVAVLGRLMFSCISSLCSKHCICCKYGIGPQLLCICAACMNPTIGSH